MAAAVDRPPYPIYVLDRIVCVGYVIAKPGEEWWEIPCASKKVYGGCSEKMQEAVEGLKLYARLGDGPLIASSLSIRMTTEARRIFESEIGINPDGPIRTDMMASAGVETAEQEGVTSIVLSFRRRSSVTIRGLRAHSYLLVYDSTNRSLSMFQIPRDEGVCTGKVIVPKRTGGSDDNKLFLLGREARLSSYKDDVSFWVGSLTSSDDGTVVQSKFKSAFSTGPFKVDVAFSCQGKGFWGDLRQGLVYCDLQASGDSDMDFGFVKFPSDCMVDKEALDPLEQVRRTRTLGCAGDSVWFVWIDMPSHYSKDVVCIWELQLPLPGAQLKGKRKEGQWNRVEIFPVTVLWELDSFKQSGLPAAPFRYPILTADGALCFVLADQSRFPRNERPPFVDHFCSFDMRYKRLLWHGLVHNYSFRESTVMYPSSNFLQMKHGER